MKKVELHFLLEVFGVSRIDKKAVKAVLDDV